MSSENPPPAAGEQSQPKQPDAPKPVGSASSKPEAPAGAQSKQHGGRDYTGAALVGLFLFLFGIGFAWHLHTTRKEKDEVKQDEQPAE